MEKGDTLSLRPNAGRSIDEFETGVAAALKGRVEVIHGETDVVDPRSPFVDEAPNR